MSPKCEDFFLKLIGKFRQLRQQVRQTWVGSDPHSDSAQQAVYVHYDPSGVIHDYVIHQLQTLVDAGFRITFVSNAPSLSDEVVSDILKMTRQILWRHNAGYDFGGYKDGISAVGSLDTVEQLLLMNDSTYGPIHSLKDILATLGNDDTDFFGLTDSWEHHYHIQGYFMIFMRRALDLPAFRAFWRRLPYVDQKKWVIHNAEIRLTQVLTRQKLRTRVLAPYWEVAKFALEKMEARDDESQPVHAPFYNQLHDLLLKGIPINPSHYFWEILIRDFGCPLVKREVLRTNPVGVPLVWRWDDAISNVSSYDTTLIRRHLQTY